MEGARPEGERKENFVYLCNTKKKVLSEKCTYRKRNMNIILFADGNVWEKVSILRIRRYS